MGGLSLEPETYPVVLFQGGDLARIDELMADVANAIAMAEQGGPKTLDETDDEAAKAAKRHDKFVAEATKRAVTVQCQVLNRRRWRSLLAEHPPRKKVEKVKDEDTGETTEEEVTEPDDRVYGFNTETMADDLVPAAIAPGQFDTPADRDEFLDGLSDRQFSKLYSAAVKHNWGGLPDPKADLSSRVRRLSAATSTSPDPSD